ncbi:MAG: DUF4129 domain-containing protein [Gammaproteobacteria bacterium]|nr:DUF4129 domain-containing protein [Gammaproteobacteria bacterium]
MRLEAITAKVRPRLGWEAIDLGFGMVHLHWKALFGIWFGLTLLPFLTSLIIFSDHIFWVVFTFLWIKPLFETALLHYLSRALFGEYPSIKKVILDFTLYGFKQWFALLTWRRFSFTRPLDIPVTQLENLKGEARARRLRTLHAFNSGSVVWLTLLFLLLQLTVYVNIVLLVFWLIPEIYLEGVLTNFWQLFWAPDSTLLQSIQAILIYSLVSFFSPFYVSAGFSVYLNQRTILEAWDIELTFKQLRDRINQQLKRHKTTLKSPSAKASTSSDNKISPTKLSCAILLVGMFSVNQAEAQTVVVTKDNSLEQALDLAEQMPFDQNKTEEQKERKLIEKQIDSVINNDPFKRKIKDSHLTFDFDFNSSPNNKKKSNDSDVQFGGFFGVFAQLAEFLLWIAVAALIIWLVLKVAALKGIISLPKKRVTSAAPEILFGVELDEKSLPEQPERTAWELWQQQKHRAALSLLLRASIVELVNTYNCEFTDGYTELECAEEVDNSTPDSISRYFAQLIHIWRLFAYGHQLPDDQQVKALCDNWRNSLFNSNDSTLEANA